MPKIKTKRGAAKRFKITGTGVVRRRKAGKNHILTKKTTKRKRELRQGQSVAKADSKAVRRLLPNA